MRARARAAKTRCLKRDTGRPGDATGTTSGANGVASLRADSRPTGGSGATLAGIFAGAAPGAASAESRFARWLTLTTSANSASGSSTRSKASAAFLARGPRPSALGGAVRAAMRKVIDTMGDRFSQNLLDHLGAEERSA